MPISQAKGEPKKPKKGMLDDPFGKDIVICCRLYPADINMNFDTIIVAGLLVPDIG